jgi:hypothetical protein
MSRWSRVDGWKQAYAGPTFRSEVDGTSLKPKLCQRYEHGNQGKKLLQSWKEILVGKIYLSVVRGGLRSTAFRS